MSLNQQESRDSSNPNPVRVMLVHEHRLALWALERLIESTGGEFVVVGRAAGGTEALRLAREARPDLALVGLDTEDPLATLLPKLVKLGRPRVIVLTSLDDDATNDRAMVGGARGVLRRGDPPEMILKAMRKVHEGELWLDRAASGRIFGLLTKIDVPADPIAARIALLTVRERNIIVMLSRLGGARQREVAVLLGLSEHTLRNHLSKIYAKLELSGHFELYLYAKQHGLDRTVPG